LVLKTYFVDFEASSLTQGSFPIEIAWVDLATGQGETYLIRPEATWTAWEVQSERVHGISRETLQTGSPAKMVAARARSVLASATLISDNPKIDQYWMDVLLSVISEKSPLFYSVNTLHAAELRRLTALVQAEPDTAEYHRQMRTVMDEGLVLIGNVVESENLKARHTHRALADAMDMWMTAMAVRRAIDLRLR
jgi:hypothetical protein